jgi:hypothetical protein
MPGAIGIARSLRRGNLSFGGRVYAASRFEDPWPENLNGSIVGGSAPEPPAPCLPHPIIRHGQRVKG